MTDTEPILPGATIGILGSGQLGRMSAMAAAHMGYRVHICSPDCDTPAGMVADCEVTADWDNEQKLIEFATACDVVTLEFENVPLSALDVISKRAPVRPGRHVLEICQNRLREKTALTEAGAKTVQFAAVSTVEEVKAFLAANDSRGIVVKSLELGYDGRGQMMIKTDSEAEAVLKEIDTTDAIAEEFIDLELEFSVIGARSPSGEFRSFGPVINAHHNHILDVSSVPAESLSSEQNADAIQMTEMILRSLDVVGVLCVEFFLTKSGEILVNELAPRPHNSGHLTIETAITSQFEQQIRAVCGLPLGSFELRSPAAMSNLLGQHVMPPLDVHGCLERFPNGKLHLYGKPEPRENRKMGHFTITADNATEAVSQAIAAREMLRAAHR